MYFLNSCYTDKGKHLAFARFWREGGVFFSAFAQKHCNMESVVSLPISIKLYFHTEIPCLQE